MVYLFLANGFEEIEALTPVDLLRRAGVEVTTVGIGGKTVTGAHHITVQADTDGDGALAMLRRGATPEMIVLPGGMPGASNLDASPVVEAFLAAAEEADAYIAAICAAPMILGKRGLLRGRRAVCYPGFEGTLTGAEVEDLPCVRDGKIITGQAMGAACAFALTLVEALKGESTAETLRGGVIAR